MVSVRMVQPILVLVKCLQDTEAYNLRHNPRLISFQLVNRRIYRPVVSGVDDRDDDLAIPELRSTARGELRPIAWRKHPKTENPNRSGNKELRDMHFPYLPEANHT